MRILRRVILGQGCCTSRACCKAPQPGSSAHSWQLWLPRQSGPCCLSPWHVRMLERQRMSRQVTTQASLLAAVGLQRAGGCPMRINSRLPLTGIARKCLCSLSTDKQLPLGINSNPVIENNLAPAGSSLFNAQQSITLPESHLLPQHARPPPLQRNCAQNLYCRSRQSACCRWPSSTPAWK